MEKDDKYYVKRMILYIDYIIQYVNNIHMKGEKMRPNHQDSDGVIYKFIQLKEEANKLSASFLNKFDDINTEIRMLSGFRNRLIHDYNNVSYSFFDEIVDLNLHELKIKLEKILKNY